MYSQMRVTGVDEVEPKLQTLTKKSSSSRRMSTVAFMCLVVQNSGIALLTKFSTSRGGLQYDPSTVVLTAEVVKLLACMCLEIYCESKVAWSSIRENPSLVIPAALYVVQNNLNLFALKGLPPATFVVCSQLKIMTTAMFSVWLLKTRLTLRKIIAICMLTLGIALVQLKVASPVHARYSAFKYILAVLAATCFSGLAGVLLEKSFKHESGSIWMKNLHLALFSIPFACFTAFRNVYWLSHSSNFFSGYNTVVVCVVLLQALGGLLSAAVMKYAGALQKCFAVSISTVICTLVGIQIGTETAELNFIIGAALVNISIFLY